MLLSQVRGTQHYKRWMKTFLPKLIAHKELLLLSQVQGWMKTFLRQLRCVRVRVCVSVFLCVCVRVHVRLNARMFV